jgi:hypothetical protein
VVGNPVVGKNPNYVGNNEDYDYRARGFKKPWSNSHHEGVPTTSKEVEALLEKQRVCSKDEYLNEHFPNGEGKVPFSSIITDAREKHIVDEMNRNFFTDRYKNSGLKLNFNNARHVRNNRAKD